MIDVLVVGSGGAGLVSALEASKNGAKVVVLSKSYPTRSQTCMAQGGINAALGHKEADSIEQHKKDTLKAAHGLADEKAVELLTSSAPEAVAFLDAIGVPFSRDKNSNIAQRRLGGASSSRACYAQDYTGLKILHTLYDQCLKEGIEFKNERFLLNYIVDTDENGVERASGATALNIQSGDVEEYRAKTVIAATGGYARLFDKNSTNSTASTGDGVAAAMRAGARLSDLEFIQFHPTALKESSILISESARGAGGHLLNAKHERFTNELAPRDEVARAIADEIEDGGAVYLDIRHLGEAFIMHELPQERKLAKLYENIDPVHDLIPIRPVAHYSMGGIEVDETSQTTLKGLYAVGECANHKVHGANRLGGNSLLELIVFGKQAGENASKNALGHERNFLESSQSDKDSAFILGLIASKSQTDFYEKRTLMGNVFYNSVGLKRDEKSLNEVLILVKQIQSDYVLMGPKDKSKVYNTNLVEFIEFGNSVELAEIVLLGAIRRNESRGAHFRSDKPQQNDEEYAAHTISYKEDGVLCVDFMK